MVHTVHTHYIVWQVYYVVYSTGDQFERGTSNKKHKKGLESKVSSLKPPFSILFYVKIL